MFRTRRVTRKFRAIELFFSFGEQNNLSLTITVKRAAAQCKSLSRSPSRRWRSILGTTPAQSPSPSDWQSKHDDGKSSCMIELAMERLALI
jgi:hypothetical protein